MKLPRVKDTYEDWEKVAETNPVALAMEEARELVAALAAGDETVVYLFGPSGVGKNVAIAGGLRRFEGKPIWSNPTSYKSLLNDLASGYRRSVPVVLQEADVVFRTDRMLNLLKRATETRPEERIYDGKKVGARIIVATNTDLTKPKTPTERAHWEPLFRRSHPVIIPNDPLDLWEYACHLAICGTLFQRDRRGNGIPQKVANEALEFFTRNIWNLNAPGPGTLHMIADLMQVYGESPRTLDRRLSGLLRPEETWSKHPTPEVPEVIPITARRAKAEPKAAPEPNDLLTILPSVLSAETGATAQKIVTRLAEAGHEFDLGTVVGALTHLKSRGDAIQTGGGAWRLAA